jgi:hypothetical protein
MHTPSSIPRIVFRSSPLTFAPTHRRPAAMTCATIVSDEDGVSFHTAAIVARASCQIIREVPARFRENKIELSISARNMPRFVRLAGTAKFHARVGVRYPTVTSYSTIIVTEALELETFPNFVRKGCLPRLDMVDSQSFADITYIRVDIFSGQKHLGHVISTLAALIWLDSTSLNIFERYSASRMLFKKSADQGVESQILLTLEAYPELPPEVHQRTSDAVCAPSFPVASISALVSFHVNSMPGFR